MQVYSADTWRSTAILLDAARIGIADGGLALSLAAHANVAMDDTGAGNPTFSLWQRDAIGCRGEGILGVVLSSDAGASPLFEIMGSWA